MKLMWKIIKESFFVVILAAVMSSVGGITLESIGTKLFALVPLLIILPALNDLVGDFGILVSMELAQWLSSKRLKTKEWWKNPQIGKFFTSFLTVNLLSVFYIIMITLAISYIKGFPLTTLFITKLVILSVFSTLTMIALIFWMTLFLGISYFKRNINPSNTLVPLISSFADMGNIMLLAILITLLF